MVSTNVEKAFNILIQEIYNSTNRRSLNGSAKKISASSTALPKSTIDPNLIEYETFDSKLNKKEGCC